MLALVAAAFLSPDWVPPVRPGLLTVIGSPAFRTTVGGWLLGVSPDGKRVYTATHWACSGGHWLTGVFVWDAQTGRVINSYNPNLEDGRISRYRFAADGLRVMAEWRPEDQPFGKYRFCLLDPDTGRVTREGKPWEAPRARATGLTDELVFLDTLSSDRWTVVNTEQEAMLVDVETGKVLHLSPALPSENSWVQVSSDGRLVLAGSGRNCATFTIFPPGSAGPSGSTATGGRQSGSRPTARRWSSGTDRMTAGRSDFGNPAEKRGRSWKTGPRRGTCGSPRTARSSS